MSAPTFKVNGYDLSPYVLWGDRSHDFDPSFEQPQFGGNTAFADGQPWVRDAAGNRQWTIPLWLNASDTDSLHALVQTINAQLSGDTFEFKPPAATNSTYFDLERGRLDPHWDIYEDNSTRLRCSLTLWTRPYGHTGTVRTVASFTGSGIVQFPATAINGDIPALAQWDVTTGSYMAAIQNPTTTIVAYAITTQPSYTALWAAASITPGGAASLTGGSGAVASQYVSVPVALDNNDTSPLTVQPPAAPFVGRHRVFAIGRTTVSPASALALRFVRETDQIYGPSVFFANTSASQWSILDMGEITVPRVGSGPVASYQFSLHQRAPTTASIVAGPGLHINAFVFVPVDYSAGVVVDYQPSSAFRHSGRRQRFEIDAWPVPAAMKGEANGTAITFDIGAQLRGDFPRVPPVASSAASGPAQAIVFAGDANNYVGNDILDIQLRVTERFTYLR